ncbi:ATP-binding protein [Streptomyces inusitatus]|nr:ATP-binding protein [Streptomyces inusitatus]
MPIKSKMHGKPSYSTTLPRAAESARDARALVSLVLCRWDLGEAEFAGRLVITELVSNAVAHARRDLVKITVTRESRTGVRLAVTDFSRVLPQTREAGDQDVSGRGLAIVEELTDGRWGVDLLGWGKTVWADLELPRTRSHGEQSH